MILEQRRRFHASFRPALSPAEQRELTDLLDRAWAERDDWIAQFCTADELRNPTPERQQRIGALEHDYFLTHPSFWTASELYRSFDCPISNSRYYDTHGETSFDAVVPRALARMTEERLAAVQRDLYQEYNALRMRPPIHPIRRLVLYAIYFLEDSAALLSGAELESQTPEGVFCAELRVAYDRLMAKYQTPTARELDLMLLEWSRFYTAYELSQSQAAPVPASAGTTR